MSFLARLRLWWTTRRQRKLGEYAEKSIGTRSPIYEDVTTDYTGPSPPSPF